VVDYWRSSSAEIIYRRISAESNPAGAHSLAIVHCPPRMGDAVHHEADLCFTEKGPTGAAIPVFVPPAVPMPNVDRNKQHLGGRHTLAIP
jgi:hypothetical protein